MSQTRGERPHRLDPDDVALIEEIQSLQGEEMPADQDAVLEPDESGAGRRPGPSWTAVSRPLTSRPPRARRRRSTGSRARSFVRERPTIRTLRRRRV